MYNSPKNKESNKNVSSVEEIVSVTKNREVLK